MTDIAVGLELAGTQGEPPLLLVHGFAGSSRAWDFVLPFLEPHFQLVLLDLPGHGTAAVQPGADLKAVSDSVAQILLEGLPEPRHLCGYSMGGRIALHAALQYPGSASKLAVIGASPGIEHADERAARVQSDNELAENIRQNGIEWFERYWSELPLFASQKELPSDKQEWLKQERLWNDPGGLANALLQWGTGRQEWLLPKLSSLDCPTLLLSGERDEKFRQLSRKMAAVIPDSQHLGIPASGHATHIEQPEATAQALISFFRSI